MEVLGAPTFALLAVAISSYLFGAIPTAYLAVRFRRGVDIRQVGSGNVGGANAIQAMGRVPGLTVMAFDVFVKGGAPVLVAGTLLDYGHGAEVIAGSAALVGHNWSVFLGFSGGRGLGTGSGVMFAMAWYIWFIFAGIGLIYWIITRNSPVGWVVALILQPILVAAFDLPREYVVYAVMFVFISATKRVASNPGERRVPDGSSRIRVYWNRLIYDRDIKDRKVWLRGDAGR